MKLWYCKPGHEPIECWTTASEHTIQTSKYIIVRMADPFDPGERECSVPAAHLVRSATCPLTRTTMDSDAIWHEVFTKAGFQYGKEEESNARAWFELGLWYSKN